MFVWVCPAELRNRVRLWLAGCVLKGASLRLCSEKEREHGEGGSESTSECAGVRAEKEKRGRFVLRWQGWKERRASARLFEAHSFSHLSCSPPSARVQPSPSNLDFSSPSLAGTFQKKNQNIPFTHTLHTGRAWSSSPRWWWVSSFCFSCLVSFSFWFCSWNKRWKGKVSACSNLRLFRWDLVERAAWRLGEQCVRVQGVEQEKESERLRALTQSRVTQIIVS